MLSGGHLPVCVYGLVLGPNGPSEMLSEGNTYAQINNRVSIMRPVGMADDFIQSLVVGGQECLEGAPHLGSGRVAFALKVGA